MLSMQIHPQTQSTTTYKSTMNTAMSLPSKSNFSTIKLNGGSLFKVHQATVVIPSDISEDWNSCQSSSLSQSENIPIRHHIHRTTSEVQLHEDEEVAEYRDYCMYCRIVSGMISPQQGESADTLRNIIRTRHSLVQGTSCSHNSTKKHFIPKFDDEQVAVYMLDSLEQQLSTSHRDSHELSDFNDAIFEMDL